MSDNRHIFKGLGQNSGSDCSKRKRLNSKGSEELDTKVNYLRKNTHKLMNNSQHYHHRKYKTRPVDGNKPVEKVKGDMKKALNDNKTSLKVSVEEEKVARTIDDIFSASNVKGERVSGKGKTNQMDNTTTKQGKFEKRLSKQQMKSKTPTEEENSVEIITDLFSVSHIESEGVNESSNQTQVNTESTEITFNNENDLPITTDIDALAPCSTDSPEVAKIKAQVRKKLLKQKAREEKARKRRITSQAMLLKGVNSINKGDILISVDIECWERNTNILTELGVTIYDGTATSSSLIDRVTNEHFIIAEYIRMRNGRFVPDNKYNFLVGKSKTQSLPNCKRTFQKLLEDCEKRAEEFGSKVLFIGHGVKSDFIILQKFNFYLGRGLKQGAIPDYFDTFDIWQLGDYEFGALGKVLTHLKIEHRAMHNAGNDAYFTMILALCLCSKPFRDVYQLNDPSINQLFDNINFDSFPINNSDQIPDVSAVYHAASSPSYLLPRSTRA